MLLSIIPLILGKHSCFNRMNTVEQSNLESLTFSVRIPCHFSSWLQDSAWKYSENVSSKPERNLLDIIVLSEFLASSSPRYRYFISTSFSSSVRLSITAQAMHQWVYCIWYTCGALSLRVDDCARAYVSVHAFCANVRECLLVHVCVSSFYSVPWSSCIYTTNKTRKYHT